MVWIMRGFRLFLLLLFLTAYSSEAEYWFQFGAIAERSASFNYGAMVYIKTVSQPVPKSGSLGFWVGETLSNGAFIQVGYLIQNQSGNYPSLCTELGCKDYEYIPAGQPEWFYEYFPPGWTGGFLGAIGPVGSAGKNGTINRYGFYSIGNTWYFQFNNETLGSEDLGTDNSGPYLPVAFGELANSSGAYSYINPVTFFNFSIYKYGTFIGVGSATAYIGYGVGSKTNVPDPYGVEEVGNKVNYFVVGSGLPNNNGSILWEKGYYLRVDSEYGNTSESGNYSQYTSVEISEPKYFYISNTERAVFEGWKGYGIGSYTGPSNSTSIIMEGDITEVAEWKVEYLVNVSSTQGEAYGSGWYENGSVANYSISSPIIYVGNDTRYVFLGWSNGYNGVKGSFVVDSPINITAKFEKQYFVNVTPQNATLGSGWYNEDSMARILVKYLALNQSPSERLAFYSWSNGNRSPELSLLVNAPIHMNAIFKKEYFVNINAVTAEGNKAYVNYYVVDNSMFEGSGFLFEGNATIQLANYKGYNITLNQKADLEGPENITVTLPLFNVNIKTTDIFGIPAKTTLVINFPNGTQERIESKGDVELYSVPFGKVYGEAYYLGVPFSFFSEGGGNVYIRVISAEDIILVISIIVFLFIYYAIHSRRLSG
ncbi:MAG: hypothetical protein QXL16_02660 [Candidatus Micrarchaeaceae archaeon]